MNKKSTIETERIILREFKLGDEYEMFSNWANDPEVVKYLTWPIHENIEVTRSIIQSWVNQYQDPKTIRFGITLKDTGELVGGIDVVHYIDGVPEVGYCLAKKCWNKGIMTEVFSAFRDYLFTLGFTIIFHIVSLVFILYGFTEGINSTFTRYSFHIGMIQIFYC